MRKFKIAAAILSLGLVAGVAQAQSIDQRHVEQQQRIRRGVETGQLTPREARRDERQQMRIERTEARMRARHGGHLTWRERARLRHREDRASRHIYRTKHNHRHW